MARTIVMEQLARQAHDLYKKNYQNIFLLLLVPVLYQILFFCVRKSSYEIKYLIEIMSWIVTSICLSILSKNMLDVVYKRPMSMLRVSALPIITASLCSSSNIREVIGSVFNYIQVIDICSGNTACIVTMSIFNSFLWFGAAYLLMRSIFISLLILEKNLSIVQACKESFKLTSSYKTFINILMFYLYLGCYAWIFVWFITLGIVIVGWQEIQSFFTTWLSGGECILAVGSVFFMSFLQLMFVLLFKEISEQVNDADLK